MGLNMCWLALQGRCEQISPRPYHPQCWTETIETETEPRFSFSFNREAWFQFQFQLFQLFLLFHRIMVLNITLRRPDLRTRPRPHRIPPPILSLY